MSDLTAMSAEKIAEVLAEHSVEDYSEGEFDGDASLLCCCHFVARGSDLYDAGQAHRRHVAEALAPLLAAEREAGIEEGVDSTWHLKEIMRREREAGRAEVRERMEAVVLSDEPFTRRRIRAALRDLP